MDFVHFNNWLKDCEKLSEAGDPVSVFVYGTLMDPGLCQQIGVSATHFVDNCVLEGFHRYRHRTECYPVCKRVKGAQVVGTVHTFPAH